MVQINFALKEINCKLVYYGPGRSGKTTNLEQVYLKAPEDSKGDLVSINTETDRTLYFDFLPLNLGKVAGMTTKFSLYTVPGQVYYNATRKLVLQGCDGVVFVADSSPHMMDENIESLENMLENLKQNGLDPEVLPIILQLNKRDVDGALSVDFMVEKLKRGDWRIIEACAFKGEGVFPTLKALAGIVISKLNDQQGAAKQTPPPPTLKPEQSAPVPPPPPVQEVQAKQEKTAIEPVEPPKQEPVEEKKAPPPPPPPAAPPSPAPTVADEPVVAKEESKSDLIAARLAKMRADKTSAPESQAVSQTEEQARPRKLQQKGFMGFIKRLFGKG